VNKYASDEELDLEHLSVDPAIEAAQRARLKQLRAERNGDRVNAILTRLESAARGNDNLMPLLIEAVENEITLGEICAVLRDVWGEYQSKSWV
jgi:methylmalonyl-CoA mutase N-terminal domain/subunit